MKKDTVTFCRLIHNCIWTFLLAYLLAFAISSIEGEPEVKIFFPVIPLVLLSFLMYEGVSNFFLYLLIQVPAFFAFYALGDYFNQLGPYLTVFAVIVFCQISDRKSPMFGPLIPRIPMLFFFLIAYLMGLIFRGGVFLYVTIICLMADIILLIIHDNNMGLTEFLNVRQNIRNLPLKQIRLSNGLFISGVLIMMGMMFVLSILFLDDTPIKTLGMWIYLLIRFLVRKIADNEAASNGDSVEMGSPEDIEDIGGEYKPPENLAPDVMPSAFWDIIAFVILGIILFALMVTIVRIIISICIAFSQRRIEGAKNPETEDEITYIKYEKAENDYASESGQSTFRKKYKKEILKKRRENGVRHRINPAFTPSQIEKETLCKALSSAEENYFKELHNSYERERYGS